jgi:hypothetical protein
MKPPDEAQSTDHPDRHYRQIRLTGERLPEGQHDEGHGEHAEDKYGEFDPIQTARGW